MCSPNLLPPLESLRNFAPLIHFHSSCCSASLIGWPAKEQMKCFLDCLQYRPSGAHASDEKWFGFGQESLLQAGTNLKADLARCLISGQLT